MLLLGSLASAARFRRRLRAWTGTKRLWNLEQLSRPAGRRYRPADSRRTEADRQEPVLIGTAIGSNGDRARPTECHFVVAIAATPRSQRMPCIDGRHRSTTIRSSHLRTALQHAREVAMLNSTQSLLGWDERTKLPPAGGDYRAEQMSYLAGLIHKKQTAPEVGEWLAELAESPLAADPHSETGADIVNLKRDYDRKTKLPQSLVEELAKLSVLGQQLWVEARKANDFARFRPLLERTIELKRQEAAAIGYEKEPYDALLDEYEPGAKTAEVARRSPACASSSCRSWPQSPPARGGRTWRRSSGRYPIDLQEKFGRRLCRGDRLRLQPRPARYDGPPVLRRHGPARRAAHHALRRELSARLALQHAARSGPRNLRAGPAGRALRPADRRGRVARHSRIAIADVGKLRRPQPGVLGALLSASPSQRSAKRWAAYRSTTFTSRSTTCGRRSFAPSRTKSRTTCTS